MNQNYYEILGVNKNSTIEEIKKAYKEKVKQYHPDVNHNINNDDIIKQINMAYEKIMENKKNSFQAISDETDYEYKTSDKDFDINNLDPDCVFIGDIYVVKYKPHYDFFASFEERTYKALKGVNVKLLRIGFETYINLDNIKTPNDAEHIKKILNSNKKDSIIIKGDFFKPFAGDQIALNVRPYVQNKELDKPKTSKIKTLNKIFSTKKEKLKI